MLRRPEKVGVNVKLGVVELNGEWAPSDKERSAAWEMYVELITRISTVPLSQDEGLLREALTSLYSIFGTTRDILRRYGPEMAEPKPGDQFNFAFIAVSILNDGLRPVLARWHPLLSDWESQRPDGTSTLAHERSWAKASELRATLEDTRLALVHYAGALATACGVPNLLDALKNQA